jgi:hypothetical protein
MLAELDGAISKLRFAAFRIIPYFPRSENHISVTQMTGIDDDSIDQLGVGETIEPDEDEPERANYRTPHLTPAHPLPHRLALARTYEVSHPITKHQKQQITP